MQDQIYFCMQALQCVLLVAGVAERRPLGAQMGREGLRGPVHLRSQQVRGALMLIQSLVEGSKKV